MKETHGKQRHQVQQKGRESPHYVKDVKIDNGADYNFNFKIRPTYKTRIMVDFGHMWTFLMCFEIITLHIRLVGPQLLSCQKENGRIHIFF